MAKTESDHSNEIEEPYLAKVFSHVLLSPGEEIAVRILDTYELTFEQKREVFNVFVWHETGSVSTLKRFGEIREDQGAIIHEMLDDDEFVDLYDEFYNEYLANLPGRDEEVLNLTRQNVSIEDVSKEVEIDIFDAEKIVTNEERERNQKEALKKLLRRKNWAEVKFLREKGLNDPQISEQLGIPLDKVRKVCSTLIFIGVIEPRGRGKARAEKFRKLAQDISNLIDSGKWDFREIGTDLNSNIKSVRRAVLMMISVGREDLIRVYDDNDRYIRKNRDDLREIEDLWNNKKLNSIQIADEIDMPVEWVRNRLRYLREKNRVERRHLVNNRDKLKEDMLAYLQDYSLMYPGERTSTKKIKLAMRRGGRTLILEIYNELAQTHDLPPLARRPGKYDRDVLKAKILGAVQGLDLSVPVNFVQMYKDLNPGCGKITFYNVYRDMAKRMSLPPLKHGGKGKINSS